MSSSEFRGHGDGKIREEEEKELRGFNNKVLSRIVHLLLATSSFLDWIIAHWQPTVAATGSTRGLLSAGLVYIDSSRLLYSQKEEKKQGTLVKLGETKPLAWRTKADEKIKVEPNFKIMV